MRFAIDVAPLAELADPSAIVRLARAAEGAGWDGLSIWDSTGVSMGTVAPDPFLALAAVAAATERLRLILSVVALPRRRPQLVVQAADTLDRICGGRFVLGVGAGGDPGDFDAFGEGASLADRVARMDADLAVLDPWLRGDAARIAASGAAEVMLVAPEPSQSPRIPIWLGGMRPAALRRAAHWDGWIAIATSDDGGSMALAPDAFGGMVRRVEEERASLGRTGTPFEVAVFGFSQHGGPTALEYAANGATWWLESLSPMRGPLDDLLAIVEAGPPSPAV
jgi:alkanesulfonate monooxygenase SsuD/methylene tetrahydromethanopterin reductase-like flavin-dependent oxidoreductase (luciferase family)